MYAELENLTKALDVIKDSDCKQVIESINRKFRELLGAHIIDVVWRKESRDGPFLDPYHWIDDTGKRGGPKGYTVTEAATGSWTWVFQNGKTLWVENLGKLDRTEPVINVASGSPVESKYIEVFEGTDSLVVVPLECKSMIRGYTQSNCPTQVV